MQEIKAETPLVYLSVEQFTSLLNNIISSQLQIKEINNKNLPEYYGIDTFCEITGYKKNTVYQLVRQHKVPTYRAKHGGKRILFCRDEVEQWRINRRAETSDNFIVERNQLIAQRLNKTLKK